MNVFISWSGEYAKAFANEIKNWLPLVIQSVDIFFSPEGIQKGEYWTTSIKKKLAESTNGIICLTKDNQNAPWIYFEAGAISNKVSNSKVFPLLFDLDISELTGPLSFFNATKFTKEDFYRLVESINNDLDTKIPNENLKKIYNILWPDLEQKINSIIDKNSKKKNIPQKENKRTDSNVLEELVKLQREAIRISNEQSGSTISKIEDFSERLLKLESNVQNLPQLLINKDLSSHFNINTLQKRIRADVNRVVIQEEQWGIIVGLIDKIPLVLYTVDLSDFYMPPWVKKGEIVHFDNRADFQFQDKQGYKVTIEGLSTIFKFSPFLNHNILINNMLSNSYKLEHVISVINDFENSSKPGFEEWKSSCIDILNKYILN